MSQVFIWPPQEAKHISIFRRNPHFMENCFYIGDDGNSLLLKSKEHDQFIGEILGPRAQHHEAMVPCTWKHWHKSASGFLFIWGDAVLFNEWTIPTRLIEILAYLRPCLEVQSNTMQTLPGFMVMVFSQISTAFLSLNDIPLSSSNRVLSSSNFQNFWICVKVHCRYLLG